MRMFPSWKRNLRLGTLAIGLAAATPHSGGACARASRPRSRGGRPCLTPTGHDAAADARGRGHGDTRAISAKQQRAIEKRTRAILRDKGITRGEVARTNAVVPVYIHKMLSASGAGDVTTAQINAQIAELNQDFAGQEATGTAANTGFTFTLAGVDTYYNNQWHTDKQSNTYRSRTRLGGKNALNIWLVDFSYLGIATFPWDYSRNPRHRRHPGPVLLAARRDGDQLQPGQDRDPRSRPLVRALPHVPGRLHEHERLGERHPGTGLVDHRLPCRS